MRPLVANANNCKFDTAHVSLYRVASAIGDSALQFKSKGLAGAAC